MMVSNNEKPKWFFYLGWVMLNFIAVVIAWYISWALMGLITNIVGGRIQIGGQSRITEDALFMYVLLPIIGLLTGIFQYTLLRRYLSHMAWWIGATLLSWLMPFAVGYFVITIVARNNDTFSLMLGLFLIGIFSGLPQWLLLRKRVNYAALWILAVGFGWSIVGVLNLVTSEPFPVLLAVGLMPAIATGIACWLLLDRLPKRELKTS